MTRPALHLIIRFAPPTPDLSLTISSPSTTTPHNLHTLIRPHLPLHLAACPIRLISAGALLPPTLPLTSSLRLPQQRERAPVPPPPRGPATAGVEEEKEKDDQVEPVYIHAAISSSSKLSAAALAEEYQTLAPLSSSTAGSSHLPKISIPSLPSSNPPLGFDALLSTGFSPAEIVSLRSQFRSIQAHIHTPDTMPSHSELLTLEERWLEQNSASGGGLVGDVEGGGASGWAGEGGGDGGALEDVLWGSVMGFFWAVGAVAWLVREEGVWSRRRSAAVIIGVSINLAVCALRGFR